MYQAAAYNYAIDAQAQLQHWPGVPCPLIPRVTDDTMDPGTHRRRMLAAHCISDLDEDAASTADTAFGRFRNKNITSADNYRDVGRALCASLELERNPYQAIQSYGAQLGIKLPQKWEENGDLYESIGEQYATKVRYDYNIAKRKAQEQAEARKKELCALAQSGVAKFIGGISGWTGGEDTLTPEELEGMEACGYSKETLKRARAAAKQYLMGYGIGGQHEGSGFVEINGPRGTATLANVADTIGDDPHARDLVLQFIEKRTMDEETERRKGKVASGNLGSAQSTFQNLLQTADDWVQDVVGMAAYTPLNIADSIQDENVHWYDALGINPSVRQLRRNAFIEDARQIHAAAVQNAKKEHPHALDTPGEAVDTVAGAAKWFLPGKWLKGAAVVSTLMENERSAAGRELAASNDLSFKQFSFWDAVGTPALKTGITAASFKAAGYVNGSVGGAVAGWWWRSASASAQRMAAALAGSRVAGFVGHTATAAVTMEEIAGLEWVLNFAVDSTIVSDTQNTSEEQGKAIVQGWSSKDAIAQKIMVGVIFGATAMPAMVRRAEFKKWKKIMGMSEEQSRRYDEAETVDERRAILEEMRAADPTGFRKRAEKAGDYVISQGEMDALAKAGIEDYILKQAGITKATLPDGRFELTRKTTDKDGNEVEEKHTYTQEQLNDYYATKHEGMVFRGMLELQSRARGEKLAAAAERMKAPFLKIIGMDKLDPTLINTLEDGQVTEKTLRALAAKARAEIETWTARYQAEGMDAQAAQDAAGKRSYGESGVPLKTLARVDADFAARAETARATGEVKGAPATAAFLMPRPLGELTLALARGEVRESEVLHDLIEARIRHALDSDPSVMEKIKASLERVNADLQRRIGDAAAILPKNREATDLDVIEAMSRLATADFLLSHEHMQLTPETHAALETARSIVGDLQTLSTLASAWKWYATTPKGRENANLLRDILEQSHAYVRDVYAEAEKQSTKEATEIINEYDALKRQRREKLMADYKASREPLPAESMEAQPETAKHPQDVPAEESITGERIPAAKFYERATVNQETGEIDPPMDAEAPQSDPQGKGRGLVGGTYHQGQEGHVYGAARISSIKLPAMFTSERARQNIDLTDPATKPVRVFRDREGNLTAMDNLGRLMLYSQRGHELVDVEVVDETDGVTRQQAEDAAMAYAIRTDCATVEQALDYFDRHHLNRAEVYERGLLTPQRDGTASPAAQIAWNLHTKAGKPLRKRLAEGGITLDHAARIADLAPSDTEAQNYALRQLDSKRKYKWETIEKRVQKFQDDRLQKYIDKNAPEDKPATFSIRDYTARKPMEDLLREQRVSALLKRARSLSDQMTSKLKLGTTDRDIRECLGRIVGLHAVMTEEFDKSPRSRHEVRKELALAAVRLKAMRDILDGKLDSDNVRALPKEVRAAAKAATDKVEYVKDYLLNTEKGLTEFAARTIEREEMDAEFDELDFLIQRAHAKLTKSGRTARGSVGAQAARNAERYRRMMAMSSMEVSSLLNNTEAAIQKAVSADSVDTAQLDALKERQAELMTYGALSERGLDALRRGSITLRQYIDTEAAAWREKQDEFFALIKTNMLDIANACPNIDPGKLAAGQTRQEQSRAQNIKHALFNFANGYDLLERLTSRLPLARRWKQRLARATDSLNVLLNADKRNERSFLSERFGLRSDRQLALWLEKTTTVRKTGISTAGARHAKRFTITVEEAERIIKLTPGQRAEERSRAAAAAALRGDPCDYPTEEAVQDMARRIAVRGFIEDKIQFMNVGKQRESYRRSEDMELSQQQAANLVLLAEQKSYALQMDALGYTPDVVEALRRFAGPQVMEYAYWSRDYLQHTGVRQVFEERMGVNFPAEENYWPGSFDTSSVSDNSNTFISGATTGRGIYPFLITRQLHTFEPNLTLGVNEVLRLALQAHRTYETRSGIADEMRQTMASSDTALRLRQLMGDWDFQRLKDFVAVVDGAYAADAVACRAERKIISWNNTAKTLTWLPGRLTSIAVQLTAINNATAARGASISGLLREIVGIRTDSGEQVMTPRKILELDCFKARYYEDGLFERLTALPQNSKFSSLSMVSNTFMRFMGMTDLWSNACGMTLLYRMEFRKWKKLYPDMEEAAIRKHCEDVVSETLHLAAQPMDATDKSIRYITSSDPIAQTIWLCKSDTLKCLATARTIGIRDRAKGGLASTLLKGYDFYRYLLPGSLMAQAVRGIFSSLNGSAPSPDDEDFPDWCLRNVLVGLTLGGYMESIPLIGGAISYGARRYVATGYTAGNRTSIDPVGIGDIAAIYEFIKLCADIVSEDDKSWDAKATLKLANALRGAGILAGTVLGDSNQAGVAVKAALNTANAVGNVARDFLIRRVNDEREEEDAEDES